MVQSVCSSWIKENRCCWNEQYFIGELFLNFPFVYPIITNNQSQNCTYFIFLHLCLILLPDSLLLFPIIQTLFLKTLHNTQIEIFFPATLLYIKFPTLQFLCIRPDILLFFHKMPLFLTWMLYFSYVNVLAWNPGKKEGGEPPTTYWCNGSYIFGIKNTP